MPAAAVILIAALFIVGHLYINNSQKLLDAESNYALEKEHTKGLLEENLALENKIVELEAHLEAQLKAADDSSYSTEYTHTQTFIYLGDYDYEGSMGGRNIIVDKFQGSKPVLIYIGEDLSDFPFEKGKYCEITFKTLIFDSGNSFKSGAVDIKDATAEGIAQIQEPPYIYG